MSAQLFEPEYDHEPPDLGVLDALGHDFADLKRVVATLGENVPMALDVDDTTTTVVQLLADLREQRKALADIEAYVEAAAVKRLPYGQTQVGDRLVDVKGGSDRKVWEHDRLTWAVCESLTVDQNGERVPEIVEIVNEVRSRILNCASVAYWRTNQLRPLGVDPDRYCVKTPGRRTVRLIDAIEQAAQ